MKLLLKFGVHRSYRNGDINSYNSSEKRAKLIASICRIERFSESKTSIYNSEISDTAGRTTRRGTQVIAERYPFPANAIILKS